MRYLKTYRTAALLGMMAASPAAFAQAQGAPAACDDAKFLSDQQAYMTGGDTSVDLPEHVCGTVTRVTPSAKTTRSGAHGYFMLDVGQGHWIRIVSDLGEMNAPAWPWVKRGDQVEVVGRYYFDNRRSQGIDWTHHGTGRSWSVPGYVIVNGTKYE